MTSTKLSSHGQNRKDLDKFTKYLVYKYVQIIVQSRLGEKVRTFSKSVSSGSDWVCVMTTAIHCHVFRTS